MAVRGLLIAVTSLVGEHKLWARGLQNSQHAGSVLMTHRLSCSMACAIFLGQGSNPRPVHWQVDSYPLFHRGSPIFSF